MDCPVAYCPDLEEVILPQSGDVLAAIRTRNVLTTPNDRVQKCRTKSGVVLLGILHSALFS